MIFYIHGFGSSGFSKKSNILKAYFGEEQVFSPSLSHIPELAIDTLKQMIVQLRDYHDITLVGSSLGGYYGAYLSKKFDLKAVLVNPSIYPYLTLASQVGINHSYHDSSDYGFIQAHIDSLKAYEVECIDAKKFLVLLQRGDEVLDYREAEVKYHDSRVIIEEGGDHSFQGFERYMSEIEKFALL
jgi:predicted esterase YcpF (UPF0227 family)